MTQNTIFHCKYFKRVECCASSAGEIYTADFTKCTIFYVTPIRLRSKVLKKVLVKIPDPRRLESTIISPRDSLTINLRL